MSRTKWLSFATHAPAQSGKYVVTIKQNSEKGHRYYNDVAYYKADTAQWFNYNPVLDVIVKEDELTKNVITFLDEPVQVHV